MNAQPILIATRGSALALAQANMALAACRAKFPGREFELKIIKTTGDKLQKASMANAAGTLPKGLFTKELEVALLEGKADLAVHSLKDLPTELPDGLILGGVCGARQDVRDVVVYKKNFPAKATLASLPKDLRAATSSTRRAAQLLGARPDFKVMEIRGNVPSRLTKLATQANMDLTILAAAGLARLHYSILDNGELAHEGKSLGVHAIFLSLEQMLPCVGQGAIGLEIRAGDEKMAEVCAALNHGETLSCVTAERAFLSGMGGGCQTPVGACAQIHDGKLRLEAISYIDSTVKRGAAEGDPGSAAALGQKVALEL